MGIRDRVVDNAARHQDAKPVSTAIGVVTSLVGVVVVLVVAVLSFAQGSVTSGVFFLVVWLLPIGNLWLRYAGRQRRRGR